MIFRLQKKWLRFFLIVLICGGSFSCATVSDELSLSKMLPKQRLYAGRINVKINGEQINKCEIYLNSDLAPSIKLSESGLVFYKTDRADLRIRTLACRQRLDARTTVWHLHRLPLESLSRRREEKEVSYIGDIKIDWTVDKQKAFEMANQDSTGPINNKEGRLEDSGELIVTVDSELEKMNKEFFSRVNEAEKLGYRLVPNLLVIKSE